MKVSQLKTIVKEAVKEAIQEEMKDILMEAVRTPKQTVYENVVGTPTTDVAAPITSTKSKEQLREEYKNILGATAQGFNTSMIGKPLQMSGKVDTTSPNGSLPEGEVSMDQIMGLMHK